MKAIALYMVALTCGLTHAYSAYGGGSGSKRRSGSMHGEHEALAYTQQMSPQYYDRVNSASSYMQAPQTQYISSAYLPQQPAPQQYQKQQPQQQQQQRKVDDRNNFYYPTQQQRDFQEPLYGYPTFHGDYDPKPYYFAQPSYMAQEDRMETTNPLDYLQAEIFQENERERNNAAFMQNLALYNQKLDSLQARQQKLQQFENMYNLKQSFEDYDIEQPTDWYDQTSILVDPNSLDNYLSSSISSDPQFQFQQWQPHSSDYDDEMVKELRELKEVKQQNKNSASNKKKSKQQKQKQQQQRKESYRNLDWQRDMPQTNNYEDEEVIEPENYDDEWINWSGQKRSIQPKKVISDVKQAQSTAAPSLTTQKSKILEKLQSKITGGQKEVVLPRPATPVRRPFSEAVMKSMGKVSESEESSKSEQQTLPIYKTIKQIIDMEQNLSHVSRIFL